ncbi:DNA-3-methyladenine glycosylase I [Alicyclobacillus ferrooxydans]|nr:DNA-3-methyladenine glycosylase I [Alicyclobacillus ferrooxydans]
MSNMDKQCRCGWVNEDELYIRYHDEEWGVPIYNDQRLFEFLILEGAQAGLSWYTILKKRENYRAAFDGFDFTSIAEYEQSDVERLLQDSGIVRNRLKVSASIDNAKGAVNLCKEFGTLSDYFWSFVDGRPVINHWPNLSEVPAQTELSIRLSKDLQKRGFRFVGPTIMYSFLQATGMVMDHITPCFRYSELSG